MAGLVADGSPRGTLLELEWRTAAFFHWAFAPDLIRRLLPPGFELDTFDGRAWIGLTPFTTTFRLGGVVSLPFRGAVRPQRARRTIHLHAARARRLPDRSMARLCHTGRHRGPLRHRARPLATTSRDACCRRRAHDRAARSPSSR